MNKILIIFNCLILFSCSKEIQNNRALEGKWNPVSFSLFDYTLLKTTPDCTGTIQFERDGKKTKTGTYDFHLLFDYNETPLNLIEKGTYHIENKNIIKLLSSEGEETIVTLVYKTKEDLVLDFPNKNELGYYIVLKK